jgi:hypothetical protein
MNGLLPMINNQPFDMHDLTPDLTINENNKIMIDMIIKAQENFILKEQSIENIAKINFANLDLINDIINNIKHITVQL